MIQLDDLAIQALTNLGSSLIGFGIFWHYICPNHRCCQQKRVNTLLETGERLISDEADNH